MNGRLIQKSYPGEFPRPSVEATYHDQQNLLIVGTPWGTKEGLKDLNDTIKDYYSASIGDGEATSPFAKLPGLSHSGNTLRIATLLANESVYNKLNKESYVTACEALIANINRSELTWIQIGQPHLCLLRQGALRPLHIALDLGLDYNNKTPLPTKLLGVERQLELETKSLLLQTGDRLIMVARSTLPREFYTCELTDKTDDQVMNLLHELMARQDSQTPFWIGLFS